MTKSILQLSPEQEPMCTPVTPHFESPLLGGRGHVGMLPPRTWQVVSLGHGNKPECVGD